MYLDVDCGFDRNTGMRAETSPGWYLGFELAKLVEMLASCLIIRGRRRV